MRAHTSTHRSLHQSILSGGVIEVLIKVRDHGNTHISSLTFPHINIRSEELLCQNTGRVRTRLLLLSHTHHSFICIIYNFNIFKSKWLTDNHVKNNCDECLRRFTVVVLIHLCCKTRWETVFTRATLVTTPIHREM